MYDDNRLNVNNVQKSNMLTKQQQQKKNKSELRV